MKVIFAALAASILSASATNAATFSVIASGDAGIADSTMTVSAVVESNSSLSVDLGWGGAGPSYSGFVDFSSDGAFDLFVTDYAVDSSLFDGSTLILSGFTLQTIDAIGAVTGTIIGPINDPGGCSTLAPPCFSVKHPSTTKIGSIFDYLVDAAVLADVSSPVLSGLAAGSYRLTSLESLNPVEGALSFSIKTSPAEVPLPATFPLILAGFAAIASLFAAGRRSADH